MSVKKFEHGGNIYSALRKTGQKPVLDFSANINPLGLSPRVRDAILSNVDKVVHYPDADAHDLKEQICQYYGVQKDMLVLGNGATELLYLLCHVTRPKKVFLPVPCFSEYERAALAAGAEAEYFYLDKAKGFKVDYAELVRAMPAGALLFLGHPNNPTGRLLGKEGFEAFVKEAKGKGCLIVLDESFIDFLPDDKSCTMRNYCLRHDNLLLIHSLTKFFAIPGLRLGFGIFPQVLAEKIKGAADCWNVNSLAQAAGCSALQDLAYIRKSKIFVAEAREKFLCALAEFMEIKVFASSVNFLLLDISEMGMAAETFCQKMFEQGILVRNCANYPGLGDAYIRIAVREDGENSRFIAAVRKIREKNDG